MSTLAPARLGLAGLALIGLLSSASLSSAKPLTKATLKNQVLHAMKSAVRVRADDGAQSVTSGGVLLPSNQAGIYHVRCTWHQLQHAKKYEVLLSKTSAPLPAKLLWKNPKADLAELEIATSASLSTVKASGRNVFDQTPVFIVVPSSKGNAIQAYAGKAEAMEFTHDNAKEENLLVKVRFVKGQARQGWSGSPVFDGRTGQYLGPLVGIPYDTTESPVAFFSVGKKPDPNLQTPALAKRPSAKNTSPSVKLRRAAKPSN